MTCDCGIPERHSHHPTLGLFLLGEPFTDANTFAKFLISEWRSSEAYRKMVAEQAAGYFAARPNAKPLAPPRYPEAEQPV